MYRRSTTERMQSSSAHKVHIGVPEPGLFDGLFLFECELVVGNAVLGQVVQYLENLSATADAILLVVTVHWVDGGTKALIREFIADVVSPWVARLTDACAALDVNFEEGCGAFLGRGVHGRIFTVDNRHRATLAMEVAEKRCSGDLYREDLALEQMHVPGVTINHVGGLH
ncbi:hypothetical protein AaE_011323 [Aphanomyces astaci]|uniref:Uncharacterized protein n=1 Tax=Aphanomyces astaci TaxID=112090 RepID=A0A6A4ZRQ8_APHAT|nr:hypothetical protein AaE_011323 [Aphanomyces astaci]